MIDCDCHYMRAKNLLIGAGAVLLLVGLLMGFMETSVANGDTPVSCGSPWSVDDKAISRAEHVDDLATAMSGGEFRWDTDWAARCDAAFGSRGGWAAGLTALGAMALLGVALISVQASMNRSAASNDRMRSDPSASTPQGPVE